MWFLLIFLGLAACSYETELSAGVGACLIIGGILYALFHREEEVVKPVPRKTPPTSDSKPYTGRTSGDTYLGVYTSDGDYVRKENLRYTIDGYPIAPNGERFDIASDGEYVPYRV